MKKESQIFKLPRTDSENEAVTKWLENQKNKSRSINLALLAMVKRYGYADLGSVMEDLFLSNWSSSDAEAKSQPTLTYAETYGKSHGKADSTSETHPKNTDSSQKNDSDPDKNMTKDQGKKYNPMDMLS